ncbi:hypothetical protein GS601_10350 [Myxacorys almedinensis A]|uniref:Uncharacterized protein n=1 Tax=Myxacorys almedinensis A TaxID=2690445 RepID=A0A8J7Z924_9CYAN|nr:hypothetical protein [Myxacorys almedinensis]NDJ17685.1 hypothetical protein [Myxacorys almedinensis A]
MKYFVCNDQLPLAVYREVAAHLSQIDGVATDVLPQTSNTFAYTQSQVGGLEIEIADPASEASTQVEKILAYYSDRFGPWERQST